MKNALIIFIKNPQFGKVKTRLAVSVGDEKALRIYQKLLQYTRDITYKLPQDKIVFYSSFLAVNDMWEDPPYIKRIQEGNDLGSRMLHAFSVCFEKGYEAVCIIGSDCPELTEDIILDAFTALKKHDLVLGPSKDGGYYLLGMNRLHHNLFHNKQWSTSSVSEDTLNEARKYHLTYHLLPLLSDIDTEEDLLSMHDKGFLKE